MILLGILLATIAAIAFVMYLAVMAAVWVVIVVFFAFAVVIGLLAGDPYVGFFAAFPATILVFWLFDQATNN